MVEPVPGWTNSYGETWAKPQQKGKPNNNSPTNTIREAVQQSCLVNHERSSFANSPISVNINEYLQSWLDDDDIIIDATFPEVRAKEPVINEYFCRSRHNNCNMIYLNQNLFSLDRQSVRENCNLFILFEQRGKVLASIYQDFFNNVELSYNDFANICNKVWKETYNYIVIDITKTKNINGKLRNNWDRRVL